MAPFFWVCRLSIVLLSSCWLAGTFFTPGLAMAREAADPLLGLVAVAGWVNTGPCLWVLFTEARQLVRSGVVEETTHSSWVSTDVGFSGRQRARLPDQSSPRTRKHRGRRV